MVKMNEQYKINKLTEVFGFHAKVKTFTVCSRPAVLKYWGRSRSGVVAVPLRGARNNRTVRLTRGVP